jgi:NTP pyrophosphatase (non-canonical NTP hydrolase)
MTPLEYKTFCKSTYACPPGTDREEYLRLLLIEELGEVASLFAKAMRDGVSRVEDGYTSDPKIDHTYGPEAVDRDSLLKELGDVMWCAAMISPRTHLNRWVHLDAYLISNGRDRKIDRIIRDVSAGALVRSFDNVQWMCAELRFSPQEVATANVEKLRGRRERGTIHGAGDER